MTLYEAMAARHSVRAFLKKDIEPETAALLKKAAQSEAEKSGLDIRLVLNEPRALTGLFAHYGGFKNARNYFLMAADRDRAEQIGYHGERLVLYAQTLGLNTCWVAGSFKKGMVRSMQGLENKLTVLIAAGYGETPGRPHKSKPMQSFYKCEGEAPEWFLKGVEAAMLAPTAINQQKFLFTLLSDGVRAEARPGPYSRIDLGIVKLHFELGAGDREFKWI